MTPDSPPPHSLTNEPEPNRESILELDLRNLPIEDSPQFRLNPASIQANRFEGSLRALLLGVAAGVGAIFLGRSEVGLDLFPWLLAAAGCFALVALTIAWYWPKIAYQYKSYRIGIEGLEIQSGVWWRQVVDVPHSRIQHTDVNQGPIERYFGLATLVIHTAGAHNAEVEIEGLGHRRALELRDLLVRDDEVDSDDAV